MTSEGQYAGEPPAEATSGGPAQPFRDDRFPPDSGASGESADHPTSYAPPPHSTPNGGSPFVVPAVFGQSPPGPTDPAFPPPRSGSSHPPGPSVGSARVPGAGDSGAPPRRDPVSPPRGSAPATGSASVPGPPPSPWGPPPATSGSPGSYGRPAEPHPRPFQDDRTGEPSGGFSAGPPPGSGAGTEGGRPPGVSAFGDQRVRVPGAALAGVPDAPQQEPGERAPSDRFQPFGFPPSSGEPSQGFRATPSPTGEPSEGYRAFGPAQAPAGEFVRRVPGASLAASGMPDAPDVPGTGVPQPRDPAERPAQGTARAVSASASVPLPSRVPPAEPGDAPPAPAAPQARVYGRPVQPVDADESRPPYIDRPDQGPAEVPPGRISGRASASASVSPPRNPPGTPTGHPTTPTGHPTSPAEPMPPGNESFGAAPAASSERAAFNQDAGPVKEPAAFNQDAGPFKEPAVFGEDAGPFGARRPQPPGRPFAGPTTDAAGRGRAHVPPRPEYYGELTTDISRRGSAPERPASSMPEWPPRDTPDAESERERPRMGGVYPGPASSPAVPDQAAGWPPYTADQGDFDRFGPAPNEPDRFSAGPPRRIKPKSESGHVRMLPILLSVVIGAVLLVGIAIGIVWLISRGSDSSFDVGAGDCVKRSGTAAVKASCSDAGAYQVVSIADTKDQCADTRQPYVLNPTKDGKTKVLCLKPAGG